MFEIKQNKITNTVSLFIYLFYFRRWKLLSVLNNSILWCIHYNWV